MGTQAQLNTNKKKEMRVVVLCLVVLGVWQLAQAGEPEFTSVCKDETTKSWAYSVLKHYTQPDASFVPPTTVYVSLAEAHDKGCEYTAPAFQVDLDSIAPEDASLWMSNTNQLDVDSQFRHVEVDDDAWKSKLKIVWRFDTHEQVFEMGVVSKIDPIDDTTQKRDIFKAQGQICHDPLPFEMKNLNNPRFKCLRVSLYPDDCERVLDVGPAGRQVIVKFGIATTESCQYETTPTEYSVMLTETPFGKSPWERSFRAIKAGSVSLRDLEQVAMQPRGSTNVFDDAGLGVMDDDGEDSGDNDSPLRTAISHVTYDRDLEKSGLPGEHWAFRTSRGERKQADGSFVSALSDPALKTDVGLLEVTTAVSDELEQALLMLVKPNTGASVKGEKRIGRDFGELVFKTTEKCSAVNTGDWITLKSQSVVLSKADSKLSFCLAINKPPATARENTESPCNFFSKLWNRPENDATALPNSVFVSIGADCDHLDRSFAMTLKQDVSGRGTADQQPPRLAEVVGAPQSLKQWSWRKIGGDIELSFINDEDHQQQAFVLAKCAESQVTWDKFVMTKRNPNQKFQCLRITTSPDACEHAIGIGNDQNAHISFEVSLTPVLNNQQECEYFGPTSSFSAAFTNELWQPLKPVDEAWKRIVVDSDTVSLPASWRWRTQQNNIMLIEFETPQDAKSTKLVTVQFQASQPCAHGRYPSLAGNWELRSKDSDAPFVCLRFSTDIVTTSDFFKQAALFELMTDLKSNPYQNQSATTDQEFGAWQKRLQDVYNKDGNADVVIQEVLKRITTVKAITAITSESSSLLDAVNAGDLSHFYSGHIPLQHHLLRTGHIMHTHGMFVRAVFVRNPRHKGNYGGIFGKDKVSLIARYSPSSMSSQKFLAGWAFKFFRSGSVPADDLVAYHSFEAQSSCDIFEKKTFSNAPVEGANLMKSPHTFGTDFARIDNLKGYMVKEFEKAEFTRLNKDKKPAAKEKIAQPMRIGIAHLFLSDADAWRSRDRASKREPISDEILARTEVPKGLIFFVDETTRVTSRKEADLDSVDAGACEQNRARLMERQLAAVKPRSPLFHVYEYDPSLKSASAYVRRPQQLLGTIVTQSSFISSWFGDAAVHFKHEPFDSDMAKLAQTANGNGNGKPKSVVDSARQALDPNPTASKKQKLAPKDDTPNEPAPLQSETDFNLPQRLRPPVFQRLSEKSSLRTDEVPGQDPNVLSTTSSTK
eukprot:c10499_g1_i1.p1 GENE.c10499_g1_i1~~c10499_g1_i1.p1  ORF type:complete len:1217 (-),score=344.00 c10499_g1_i1:66-3716(-)